MRTKCPVSFILSLKSPLLWGAVACELLSPPGLFAGFSCSLQGLSLPSNLPLYNANSWAAFCGFMPEFPDIRGMRSFLMPLDRVLMIIVDYFHKLVNRRPPLACFLSHVHSDHLAGLEALKAPLYVSSLFMICTLT
jgi:hypothetical protein